MSKRMYSDCVTIKSDTESAMIWGALSIGHGDQGLYIIIVTPAHTECQVLRLRGLSGERHAPNVLTLRNY